MYTFAYCAEKNKKLQEQRSITFDEIIALIHDEKHLLGVLEHPNQVDYPGQKIYLLDIDNYVWLVPYVQQGKEIFLKTAFPSRKHTKQYQGDPHEE